MMTIPIHPATHIGAVHLTVADLDRSLAFYQRRLGFKLRDRSGATAFLGAGGPDIVVLTEQPGAQRAAGTTGLYHFAVLVPSRLELARVLRNISRTKTPVQGFGDHLVSEAIYLADPDGTGIEIYRDRPPEEWPRDDGGRIRMATDPLDIDSLLAELDGQPASWAGLHAQTMTGHIHLHVADLDQAEAFYGDVLGFSRVLRLGGSASFLSAGGYHHHVGINTWAGVGAPPPPAGALGLRWYTIRLPNSDELRKTVERVRDAGIPIEERADGYLIRDPSHNGIVLAL